MPLKITPPAGTRTIAGRTLGRGLGAVERTAKQGVRWALGHGIPRTVIIRSSRKGDLQGDLILSGPGSHTFDLVDLFEELRSRGPLYRGGFSHVATDHEVIKEVLTSNDFVTGFFAPDESGTGVLSRAAMWSATDVFAPLQPPSLLATEPPEHTRYRKLVTRVFTVRAVERLRARTEEIARELLDDLEKKAASGADVDLVSGYCGLLPITVISEVLGVPVELRERMLELGKGAALSLDIGLEWRTFREMESSLEAFDTWLRGHLEYLAEHPGDDLLSQLVALRDDGDRLSEKELRSVAGLVFAAGFETTVNLIGNGIALLHDNPEQLAVLKAQPDLWSNASDEILRLDPPVLLTGRVARRDSTIAGQPIPRGTIINTVLAAANRDPAVFTDPDTFDVTRENARDHLSFSSGRHFCLGAALARMEGEIGLRLLFERFPDLKIVGERKRHPTRILRGYSQLRARLS
ncbi:cytochrome P450 [Nocardioides luteus]|uniref:Cytochrome P450 n=1 Tax=Nocardioides luteus TaxID=1844 RepID=A0ABQ5T1T0_9ACTN|nr:cytochrome P450 [Nocardioides luteus]MDR7312882.1 cytochrome P450 [Nocardioides luteus]GGR48222.1 cytochrome P450 [Nocardioides luteus]GLJ69136.1 cytochrome P450 [Nocardioides luteus]